MQCLQDENHLKAIPYLVASEQVDEAIDVLCVNKYFREAWFVAKMRKDEENKVFSSILELWTKDYADKGAFEAAAVL